jgi:hypothetical protein
MEGGGLGWNLHYIGRYPTKRQCSTTKNHIQKTRGPRLEETGVLQGDKQMGAIRGHGAQPRESYRVA